MTAIHRRAETVAEDAEGVHSVPIGGRLLPPQGAPPHQFRTWRQPRPPKGPWRVTIVLCATGGVFAAVWALAGPGFTIGDIDISDVVHINIGNTDASGSEDER
ncbi:hypothetical protein [Streptomyces aidingensis]|uniref:Uncharacterized protein n=1 Tax=Streptomyces aidingensis TaxID=910347 RepID=A0A1I1TVR0_9ACTN|nr:hypothetical protein [Streptomyces aidingensis]SFD62721.1 hypothetical protein SAMN05421773_12162 [Streptomyces aidingensis]